MRDKFVAGAGLSYGDNTSFGISTHAHTLATDPHTHEILPGAGGTLAGANISATTGPASDSGNTHVAYNMPEYYASAYIMKL